MSMLHLTFVSSMNFRTTLETTSISQSGPRSLVQCFGSLHIYGRKMMPQTGRYLHMYMTAWQVCVTPRMIYPVTVVVRIYIIDRNISSYATSLSHINIT